MTEETQALVDRLLWSHKMLGQGELGMALSGHKLMMTIEDAAAALTALARDLETARQERDAALVERNAARARAADSEARLASASVHEARAIAAVRAARAETWAHAAQVASDQGHYRLEKAFSAHASAAREGQ